MKNSRRRLLATVGALSVGPLAGCSGVGLPGGNGDGSEESSGPPESVETTDGPGELALYGANWSDGSTVGLDDETTFEVYVANRGGEAVEPEELVASFSHPDTSAFADPRELSSVDGAIESGDVVTLTSETVTARYAGDFDIVVAEVSGSGLFSTEEALPVDDPDTVTLSVEPMRVDPSESVDLGREMEFSVDSVAYWDSIHYTVRESPGLGYNERLRVRPTLSDQTVTIVNVAVRNAGDTGSHSAAGFFFGDQQAPEEIEGEAVSEIPILPNDPLSGATIDSGSESVYAVPFVLSHEDVHGGQFTFTREPSIEGPDIVWEIDESDATFPEFEFVSMDTPAERAEGSQSLEFTVENVGDGAGTFCGAVRWKSDSEDEFGYTLAGNETLVAEAEPGETATVTTSTDNDELDETYYYSFEPFGETFTIEASE